MGADDTHCDGNAGVLLAISKVMRLQVKIAVRHIVFLTSVIYEVISKEIPCRDCPVAEK